MTKAKTSQTQQSEPKTPPFNPMAAFTDLTAANLERLNAWTNEYTAWEAKVQSRASAASEHVTELANETMQYVTALVSDWRNQAREAIAEATRRGGEMFRN